MPIYELNCKKCKKTSEIIDSYKNYTKNKYKCNICNKALKKVVSTGFFKLKGDGFYKPTNNLED